VSKTITESPLIYSLQTLVPFQDLQVLASFAHAEVVDAEVVEAEVVDEEVAVLDPDYHPPVCEALNL